MPKPPSSYPSFATPCDMRLPQAALQLRLRHSPPLSTARFLAGISVTAWLYRDKAGVQGIQVNPNTTIEELIRKFVPAETPDAEVGFHSEMERHKQQSGRDFESRLQLVVRDIRHSFVRDGFRGSLPQRPYIRRGQRRGFTVGLPAHGSLGRTDFRMRDAEK